MHTQLWASWSGTQGAAEIVPDSAALPHGADAGSIGADGTILPSGAVLPHWAGQGSLVSNAVIQPEAAAMAHAADEGSLSAASPVISPVPAWHPHSAGQGLVVNPDGGLIVETGDFVPFADSFVSLAEMDAWAGERGQSEWLALQQSERVAALRRAADFLSFAYQWRGEPEDMDHTVAWPRRGVPNVSTFYVPAAVRTAQRLLAIEAAKGELGSVAGVPPHLVSERQSLDGVGSIDRRYDERRPPVPRYPLVEAVLSGLIIGPQTGSTVTLLNRVRS